MDLPHPMVSVAGWKRRLLFLIPVSPRARVPSSQAEKKTAGCPNSRPAVRCALVRKNTRLSSPLRQPIPPDGSGYAPPERSLQRRFPLSVDDFRAVAGCFRRPSGERTDFVRHNAETSAGFPGARRFHCGVQRQYVALCKRISSCKGITTLIRWLFRFLWPPGFLADRSLS